jgi:hypothetical protein
VLINTKKDARPILGEGPHSTVKIPLEVLKKLSLYVMYRWGQVAMRDRVKQKDPV